MNFEKMSVSEIRDLMVGTGRFTREEVDNIKGKASLVYEYKKLGLTPEENTADEVFANAEIIQEDFTSDVGEVENVKRQTWPSITSAEWQSFVMSFFLPTELEDGYPKLDGLRRVAELLLGEVVFSGPVQYIPSTEQSLPGRSSVMYELRIAWKLGEIFLDPTTDEYTVRTYRAVADSWQSNTDKEFWVYGLAIAETRAEARAYRKALRLNTIAAEEKTSQNLKEVVEDIVANAGNSDWNPNDCIAGAQVLLINKLCERLGIDVSKFIGLGATKYDSIEDIPKATALLMIKELNKYQNDSKEIPARVKLEKKEEVVNETTLQN